MGKLGKGHYLMEVKHKKPKYLITLIISGFILILGLIMLFTLEETYKSLSNVLIAFGSLGFIFGLTMFMCVLGYIYEAVFDVESVTIKKANKEAFIEYLSIKNMEYVKPSIINYVFIVSGSLFPGILRINYDNQEGKSKSFFIRMKYKDFEKLPKKYKDLVK